MPEFYFEFGLFNVYLTILHEKVFKKKLTIGCDEQYIRGRWQF